MTKQWKNGMPPVGEKCEVEKTENNWIEGKTVGHDPDFDCAVVYVRELGYRGYCAESIRPLQTEEEKEREELIDKIESTSFSGFVPGSVSAEAIAGFVLQDRKERDVVPISLEEFMHDDTPSTWKGMFLWLEENYHIKVKG